MTRKIGNTVIIEPEPPEICELCGKLDELRPYGKNRERICYECAMKDKETTEMQMDAILFAEPGEKPQ